MGVAAMTNAQGPMPNVGTCERCGDQFTYQFGSVRRRRRTRCDKCLHAVLLQNKKDGYARRKLSVMEKRAQDDGALHKMALRTQEEASAVLGIFKQEVTRTERLALVRLRKLLLEPVCIYREPVAPLDFSFREMEVDLQRWRSVLSVLLAEAEESDDADLINLGVELAAEILNFDNALQKAVNDGRGKKSVKIILMNTGSKPCPLPVEVANAPGHFREYTEQEARELGSQAADSMIELFSAASPPVAESESESESGSGSENGDEAGGNL